MLSGYLITVMMLFVAYVVPDVVHRDMTSLVGAALVLHVIFGLVLLLPAMVAVEPLSAASFSIKKFIAGVLVLIPVVAMGLLFASGGRYSLLFPIAGMVYVIPPLICIPSLLALRPLGQAPDPGKKTDEGIEIVYRGKDEYAVYAIAEAIKAEGIECGVHGNATAGMFTGFVALDGITDMNVTVLKSDFSRAREIADKWLQNES